jgi:transposase
MTNAFENFILKQLINSTAKDVSEKFSITQDLIEGIVNRRIGLNIDWNTCKPFAIGIDEIALRKGHKQYLTIISDISEPGKTKVLAVLDGRKKDDIKPFLDSIPDKVIKNLQSICIDMSGSYFAALQDRLDKEQFTRIVTIDRFHIAKLIGAKVDKQRKRMLADLKREYSQNKEVLESLKGTMWPFRYHTKDLTEEGELKLETLFAVDSELKELRDLREEFYYIFEKQQPRSEAQAEIEIWIKKSRKYKAFESFISTYRVYEIHILNYFDYRHTSGPVEGMNNKLKVIKRRCFGFRNVVYFAKRIFLDINYKSSLIPCF